MLGQVENVSEAELVKARHNMIEQQIRPWDVLDERVLQLLDETPRDDFVPADYRRLAYADLAIPLDHDQEMMAPKVEARMLQSLNIAATDDILEIGTGSGYVTALLAKSGHHVYSVDIFSDFVQQAREKLQRHAIDNITLEEGDAVQGWEKHAPYDVIAVTGSLPLLPDALKTSIRPGGRMFVVVGESPVMEAMLITRVGQREWIEESLFETELPPLINAPQPSRFVF